MIDHAICLLGLWVADTTRDEASRRNIDLRIEERLNQDLGRFLAAIAPSGTRVITVERRHEPYHWLGHASTTATRHYDMIEWSDPLPPKGLYVLTQAHRDPDGTYWGPGTRLEPLS